MWQETVVRARRRLLVLGAALALLAACRRETQKSPPTAGSVSSGATSAAPLATLPTRAKVSPAGDPVAAVPPAAVELGAAHGLVAGALQDVGPAAPAAAAAQGVVLVARDDRLKLARAVRRTGRGAEATKLQPIEEQQTHFAGFGRGPSVLGDHVYWISNTRLVRRRIEGDAPVETLARDARDGTRVAAGQVGEGGPVAVVFLGRATDRIVARVWLEGGSVRDVSPEGAAASSVAVVRTGAGLVALVLEGRTSMSPIHARRIRFDGSRPVLDEDVVVWVGGSAQPLTELAAVAGERDVAVLVAMEQDATQFGLVRLAVDVPPRMSSRTQWQLYPNGLDPAPMGAAEVCGRRVAVFARPAEAQPRAPQELALSILGHDGIGPPAVLARARAFIDLSIAAVEGGALVAWVADHRTWALPLGCRAPAAAK